MILTCERVEEGRVQEGRVEEGGGREGGGGEGGGWRKEGGRVEEGEWRREEGGGGREEGRREEGRREEGGEGGVEIEGYRLTTTISTNLFWVLVMNFDADAYGGDSFPQGVSQILIHQPPEHFSWNQLARH